MHRTSFLRRTGFNKQSLTKKKYSFLRRRKGLVRFSPKRYIQGLGKFPEVHHTKEGYDKNYSYMVIGGLGVSTAVLAKNAVTKLVTSMNAAADVISNANIEVDISKLAPGQSMTISWRGKPVFIRYRTDEEIEAARSVDPQELRDTENALDEERTVKPEYIVLIGVCTHLGCVPLNDKGDYHGWLCPCHYSHYDTSGRIRKGPAPKNLPVPPYKFLEDNLLYIGD